MLFASVAADEMSVVLDGRTAARGIDDDRIEAARHFCAPGGDVSARQRLALGAAAHVQRQRAATADARRDHDLAAVPLQKPDGRRIDVAVERLLRAARQQGDARLSGTFGEKDCRRKNFARGGRAAARSIRLRRRAGRRPATDSQAAQAAAPAQNAADRAKARASSRRSMRSPSGRR